MNYIKEIRKEKHITCTSIAKKVGISQSYLSRIENNQRDLSFEDAIKIADALNVSVKRLITGKANESIKGVREKIDEIDKEMARLYTERMIAVDEINRLKHLRRLPIENKDRENEVINNNLKYVDKEYFEYYKDFINNVIKESKEYQIKKSA